MLLGIALCSGLSQSTAHSLTLTRLDSAHDVTIVNAKALLMRLDLLTATDQSDFTKSEKKSLRTECRHIRKDLQELRGGRYFRTSLLVLVLLIPVSVFQWTE